MKATTSIQGLEERIEQLVREHIEAIRAAAASAVARAFAGSTRRSAPPSAARPTSTRRPPSRRRTAEEVLDLAERLCAAVQASPGEKMTTLAAQVGATPRELAVAAARLRRADRIRSVGQRQYTKYFPAASQGPTQAP